MFINKFEMGFPATQSNTVLEQLQPSLLPTLKGYDAFGLPFPSMILVNSGF